MHSLEIIIARNEKAQNERKEKEKKEESNIMHEKRMLMKQAYAQWK